MSSDAGYAAFLGRAQKYHSHTPNGAPTPESASASASTSAPASAAAKPEVNPTAAATTTTVRVPGERYYVSDADEPFESISFSWEKKTLPDKYEFLRLVGVQNGREITQLDPSTWDSRGEYVDIVLAVTKAAGGGVVRVYRLEGSGSRVEYFIVGVDAAKGKIVGFKVLSIES